ncbi:MAG: hypothetical protein FWD39_06915 [Clostridiales bacterium]|nr:hypothetical protein [Clostridiales bacterium]
MNRRCAGVLFSLTGALLLIGRYVVAAICANGAAQGLEAWGRGFFEEALEMTGLLLSASIVCFLIGAAYLIYAEIYKEK